jgi:hypothetical protein
VTPDEVVDLQLSAYNARDTDSFVATYAEDARIFDLNNSIPIFSGRNQIRQHYSTKRFQNPALRAEILKRIVSGNKVIDLEKTWGIQEEPLTGPVIYEVNGNFIQNVWFINPDTVELPAGAA